MKRRALLLGLLLAPAAAPAPAEAQVVVSFGGHPGVFFGAPRRRFRVRRCRLVRFQQPLVDRFGRVVAHRAVVQEICR